jgi:hypothetical protein
MGKLDSTNAVLLLVLTFRTLEALKCPPYSSAVIVIPCTIRGTMIYVEWFFVGKEFAYTGCNGCHCSVVALYCL